LLLLCTVDTTRHVRDLHYLELSLTHTHTL
jgi:hypothetical protein